MNKIIESKIAKLQELQEFEQNTQKKFENAVNILLTFIQDTEEEINDMDKSKRAIAKVYLKRAHLAIKAINGETRVVNKEDKTDAEPAKKGGNK